MTFTEVSVGSMRELQPHHAVLEAAVDLVAGVAEDLDHPPVLRQHVGDELVDAALAAGLREVLEQQLADAAALVGVLHEEGDLGLGDALLLGLLRRQPVEPADRDHLVRRR